MLSTVSATMMWGGCSFCTLSGCPKGKMVNHTQLGIHWYIIVLIACCNNILIPMISETALLSLIAMSNSQLRNSDLHMTNECCLFFVYHSADNDCLLIDCWTDLLNDCWTDLLSLRGAVQVCGSYSVLPWSVAAVSLIISAISVICMLSQWWVNTIFALKFVNKRSSPTILSYRKAGQKTRAKEDDSTYMSLQKTHPTSEYDVIHQPWVECFSDLLNHQFNV